MRFVITPYAVAEWCAALAAVSVATSVWKRRSSPGGTVFFLMMVAAFIWAGGSGFEASVVGIPGKLLFSVLAYVGTVSAPPLQLVFSLSYRRHGTRPAWWVISGLWLIPLATLALAATNGSHGLVWSRLVPEPGSTIVLYEHGAWFWVALVYDAILSLTATAVIGWTAFRARGMHVAQAVVLLSALALPWIGVILYLTPASPFPGLELSPIAFILSGPLLLLGLRRYRLLDVVPVARDLLVENMADGLVVLDDLERILDANPAARMMFRIGHGAFGRSLRDAVPLLAPILSLRQTDASVGLELTLPGDPVRHLDVRSTALGSRGSTAGYLLVIRDLTERKRLELEKERLIHELQAALADIKTLEGLLPICSSCKKIRDDNGYWRTVEKYFADRSEIQFTHSLCPECVRKLFPEAADSILRDPSPAGS